MWLYLILNSDEFVANRQLSDNYYSVSLWDFNTLYFTAIFKSPSSAGGSKDMSSEDFCEMLDELLLSSKANRSLIEKSEKSLSFKSSMKMGFANFSWIFKLEKIDATDFVREFLNFLDWKNSKLFTQREQKFDFSSQKEGKKEDQPMSEDLPSDVPSSDSALPILLEMEREAKISNISTGAPSDALEKPRQTSSSITKEAQRRKELEAIDAASKAGTGPPSSTVKKPRRFI